MLRTKKFPSDVFWHVVARVFYKKNVTFKMARGSTCILQKNVTFKMARGSTCILQKKLYFQNGTCILQKKNFTFKMARGSSTVHVVAARYSVTVI